MKRYTAILILFALFCIFPAFAGQRPTITFNGQNYYLADTHFQTDYTYSPVNLLELYILEGETRDNFTKSISRITFLQISDYKPSLKSRLSEFKEDNKGIPFEEFHEENKAILNVSFWWPFRPTVVYKNVFVFQQDKVANRAMCYIVTELQFFDSIKTTNADLVKQGKALLLNESIVKAAAQLNF
jgi:hypothetical protein